MWPARSAAAIFFGRVAIMLGFLRGHPYLFALALALLTAGLVWAYTRTLTSDPEQQRTTFYKTLAAGVVAALALTWLVHRREPVATEPFPAD